MLQVTQIYSWQVRSIDCFAKVVDQTLLNEASTGIPQAIMSDFYGQELRDGEEVFVDFIVGGSKLSCKIKRAQGRHRLFMNEFRQYLRSRNVAINDLLIFDRALGTDNQFYVSVISTSDKLIVSPLDIELLIGENFKTTSTRRIGQEAFRELLMRKYNARCCLSGIRDIETTSVSIVKASHIKPWAESSAEEKVNVNNGLLLAPHYDALFDKHLISFDNDGAMVTSRHITEDISQSWGLKGLKLACLTEEMRSFLKHHRERLNA